MLDSVLGFAASPVATLTAWGHELLRWLLPMNAWTAGLLGVAFLLDKALSERMRASWRLALYAPVGLRLLLPLSWQIPLAHTPRVVTLLTPRPDGFVTPNTAQVHGPAFSWFAALGVAYVVVALAVVVVRLQAYLWLRRELQGARVARALTATANAPCPVLEHEALGPMVVGTIRPRIVLPSLLLSPERADALGCVLAHESAHVRRGDPWLMAAIQVLTIACWPVLPLWLAARRVRNLVEMACDDLALEDADASARHRYGHALIELAGWRTVSLRPLAAGQLHFGSGLRMRIQALAERRIWSRRAQAVLVGSTVVAMAACSSVGPTSAPNGGAAGAAASVGPAAAAPPLDEKALLARCPNMVKRFLGWSDPLVKWTTGPVDGIPADEVAYCRSAPVLSAIEERLWASEAANTIGQMAKDIAAAWERSSAAGKPQLCPSDGPLPRTMQARGQSYQPTVADWNSPGFSCMAFAMDQPIFFQYSLHTDDKGFLITARAQRPRGDHGVELAVALSGEIRPDNVLNIAPNLEEKWVEVP